MTLAEIFDKGGIIVWVLLVYSFIAMVLVIERLLHYYLMGRPEKNLEDKLHQAIKSQQLESELNSLRGPEIRLMQSIYTASKNHHNDLQSVASRYGSQELQSMQRGFRTLSILGHTAPLLGLLGTIIGMIKAFMVIELAGGQVDAQALAGGIWEAMLTTGVGLAVSIPILLLLHMLEGIADKRANTMRYYSMLLLEILPADRSAANSDNHETNAIKQKGAVHAV